MSEYNREEYVAQQYLRHEGDDHTSHVVRDGHFPVFCKGRSMVVPCVSDVCTQCKQTISAAEFIFSEVHMDRVNGDSGYGFEAMHSRCWDEMVAFSVAGRLLHDFFQTLDEAGLLYESLRAFSMGRKDFLEYKEYTASKEAESKWVQYYAKPEDEVNNAQPEAVAAVNQALSVIRDENPTRLMYAPHEACDCPTCDEARYNSSPDFDVDKFYSQPVIKLVDPELEKLLDEEEAEFNRGFNSYNDDGPF
jgi:hypothetical protein